MSFTAEQLTPVNYRSWIEEGTYSARLDLTKPVAVEEIVQRIGAIVTAKAAQNENWPVSGFIPASQGERSSSVLFACDPDLNRNGNPTPRETRFIVPQLLAIYQATHGDILRFRDEPVDKDFRVLPGLIKGGYDSDSYTYTHDEIQTLLSEITQDDSQLHITPGIIFSARDDFWYLEPGLDIRGPITLANHVLNVINTTDQHRAVFEFFSDGVTQTLERPSS